jgi:hypothetical protein
MNEITVFFRDDDVGILTDPLRSVVELLIQEAVPCNYQVVPSLLSPETAEYVKAARAEHASLVFLNQHGYRHQQEVDGEHRYSEFDAGRSYEDQHRDIERGAELLRASLGDAFDASIFTPPCHKYDANTLRALGEQGFEILSAGVRVDPASRAYYMLGSALGRIRFLRRRVSYHGRATPGSHLVEVSVCIDVDEDVDAAGTRIEKSGDDLWREFQACSARLDVVGIMLHHERYLEARNLDVLRGFVQRLKAEPRVRFANIQDIAGRFTP